MRYFLIFAFFFTISRISIGQRCASDVLHEEKKTKNPSLYKQQEDFKKQLNLIIQSNNNKAAKLSAVETVYSIPVVVHVIYNNTSATNISDAQVLSQIEVLNEDYRKKSGTNGYNTNPVGDDVKIEFCLATTDPSGNLTSGINRVFNAKTSWDVSSSDETTLKSLSYWPSDQYLNLWICKLSSGYLGYAQYPVGAALSGPSGGAPELDGVVIDYRAFGKGVGTAGAHPYELYYLGRTTTHEVGHWLGLVHIWGEGSGCGTDYVADTPLDAGANQDSDCKDSSDCDGNLIYTQDMTANYLDYSPDVCMNIFTTDQKTRMRTALETAPRRTAVLSSQGCCGSGSPALIPFTEGFESGVSSFWNIGSSGGGSPKWAITTPGGFGKSTQSIFMDNDLAAVGQVDSLASGFIKFTGVTPVLVFDLAYANNGSLQTDSLVISYSLNCTDWTPLTSLSGNSLITTSRVTDSFSPLPYSEWKRIKIDLSPLNNKPLGKIRFENYSKGVNKIFIDNINIYMQSTTGCYLSSLPERIPFEEDFESGLSSWYVENPDPNSSEWAIANPGGFGKSSNSISINNDAAFPGEVDSLRSNYMDFSGIEPFMEFDLAYANNTSPDTDSLVVSYSYNCTNWYPILKLSGNSLVTTSRITDTFSPLDSEWKRIRIDLDPLNYKSIGIVRFENYSKSVNDIYIDNINIYKTSSQLLINPYPNPSTDLLNIDVTFSEIKDVKYELIDMLGQKIFEANDVQKTSYIKTIDISGIAKGMYILRVTTSGQRAIKKVIFY